jgi:hypothetical protein
MELKRILSQVGCHAPEGSRLPTSWAERETIRFLQAILKSNKKNAVNYRNALFIGSN